MKIFKNIPFFETSIYNMAQTNKILNIYRSFPCFRGKLRIGKMIFKKWVNFNEEINLKAHYNVLYTIPNTKENVGLELLINGIYEKKSIDFLLKNVDDNTFFFDIGANIGAIGLPVLKKKKSIQYIAFEASPWIADFLRLNLKQNAVVDFEVINQAVYHNDNEKLKFYQSELYGKSSLAPTYSQQFIEVDSVTLDKFCEEKNIHTIDWMKVDVQGFELNVFKGAQKLLNEKRIKNILFEYEPWVEDQANIPRGEAQKFISDLGYVLYDIYGNKWIDNNTNNKMIWARLT